MNDIKTTFFLINKNYNVNNERHKIQKGQTQKTAWNRKRQQREQMTWTGKTQAQIATSNRKQEDPKRKQ